MIAYLLLGQPIQIISLISQPIYQQRLKPLDIKGHIYTWLVIHVQNSRSQRHNEVIHSHQIMGQPDGLQNTLQDTRAPITMQVLLTLLQALDQTCTSNYEVYRFEATFCLAFFRFLRVGELSSKTLRKHNSRPSGIATFTLLRLTGNKMRIRQSKLDELGQSVTLYLLETGGLECPVSSIINFFGGTFTGYKSRPISGSF